MDIEELKEDDLNENKDELLEDIVSFWIN